MVAIETSATNTELFLKIDEPYRLYSEVDEPYRLSSELDERHRLPPELDESYRSLLRALRRKKGFGLFFVRSSVQADTLIKLLRKDLAKKIIQVLEIDRQTKTLYDQVSELRNEASFDLLLLKGLENALYDYEDTERISGWGDKNLYAYNWKGVPPILNHLRGCLRS